MIDHLYMYMLIMALSHSAVNPLLYIIFSTRAVRAAFVRLRQRAAPSCCGRKRADKSHGRAKGCLL